MKRIIILFGALFLGLSSLYSQGANKELELSTAGEQAIEWIESTVDLGTIEWKKPKEAVFVLKNTGKVPIFITDVKASCGCTKVDYPKHPVKPKESVEIKVTYNAGSKGNFRKSVRVFIKDEPTAHLLAIKGTVE